MARPRGSRSIGGWTYTPAQMEAAGLLPEGSTVTKTVTQSDGSTITRTDVKQGIDPLAIFKGKTTDEKRKAGVTNKLKSAKQGQKAAKKWAEKVTNLSIPEKAPRLIKEREAVGSLFQKMTKEMSDEAEKIGLTSRDFWSLITSVNEGATLLKGKSKFAKEYYSNTTNSVRSNLTKAAKILESRRGY